MAPTPLILSPALPSELLTYIIQHERHPTTLIICSTRADFLASLVEDVRRSAPGPTSKDEADPPPRSLLSYPLYQVAVARHIRLVFIPTVSHLRAYLSVFSHADAKVPPPPADAPASVRGRGKQPLLLLYGFLGLHRDTSEWSAQGISATAAALVEAGRRCAFRAVVVDAPRVEMGSETGSGEMDDAGDEAAGNGREFSMLDEVPILSAGVVGVGMDLDDAAWTARKVTIGRALGRWFRYEERSWSSQAHEGFE